VAAVPLERWDRFAGALVHDQIDGVGREPDGSYPRQVPSDLGTRGGERPETRSQGLDGDRLLGGAQGLLRLRGGVGGERDPLPGTA